jgi:hypothetical protein
MGEAGAGNAGTGACYIAIRLYSMGNGIKQDLLPPDPYLLYH